MIPYLQTWCSSSHINDLSKALTQGRDAQRCSDQIFQKKEHHKSNQFNNISITCNA